MVGIRLEGRLGNQLFQYAFILAASERLATTFFIDQYIERSVIDQYFIIKANAGLKRLPDIGLTKLFGIKGFKNIFSFYLRRIYYKYFALLNRLPLIEYGYRVGVQDIFFQDNCIYGGYFQSEIFFCEIENLVRERFVLKGVYVNRFKMNFGDFYRKNRVVTVHIRRTDYQNLGHLDLGGNDLSLPVDYYKKAIAKFRGQNVQFLFISDDKDFVAENFKEITNKVISSDDEITDFQHLLQADGCIISNSTFSWWGAWLNSKANKQIYAPRYFMGWRIKQETPGNIYPENWHQVDF